MRRLIINADDLGLTRGVNRAILRAVTEGIVTSATVMTSGTAFEEAVAETKQLTSDTRFSVGCHLVLVDGVPVAETSRIPSLLTNGRLRNSVGRFGFLAQRGDISGSDIYTEAVAQITKAQQSGIRLSHFDAHKHSHMFPKVLAPALRAAAECGISAVRNPFEPPQPVPFSLLRKHPKLFKRYAQVALLRTMRPAWMRSVREHGLKTTDGSLGVVITGDMTRETLTAVLEYMPEGTWELVCHPGYNDSELAGIHTRLRESREQELELLTSFETRALLDRLGIELISYREL